LLRFFSWLYFDFLSTSQEIGCEEHLQYDLFSFEWHVKHQEFPLVLRSPHLWRPKKIRPWKVLKLDIGTKKSWKVLIFDHKGAEKKQASMLVAVL